MVAMCWLCALLIYQIVGHLQPGQMKCMYDPPPHVQLHEAKVLSKCYLCPCKRSINASNQCPKWHKAIPTLVSNLYENQSSTTTMIKRWLLLQRRKLTNWSVSNYFNLWWGSIQVTLLYLLSWRYVNTGIVSSGCHMSQQQLLFWCGRYSPTIVCCIRTLVVIEAIHILVIFNSNSTLSCPSIYRHLSK
jgi:hypothetical protein